MTPAAADLQAVPTGVSLQLRSVVTRGGELELSLIDVDVPMPQSHEVLIRVDATPINPSDLGLLLAGADIATARVSGTVQRPLVTARIPDASMKNQTARLDLSMPVGNEGAGVVVATGASPEARALLGKTVAVYAGAMYAQYRCVEAADCLVLPEWATARDGASCFVNPLTALCMVETMRRENHIALVHTAAASNLGQMLHRICLADSIQLVNIVRKPEQANLLRSMGATHVCDTSAPGFISTLTEALFATGATIAFDATGGGELAGQILYCMEEAAKRRVKGHDRYGTNVHKQAYLYGVLDPRPVTFIRSFGMAWGIGRWLLFPYLGKLGADVERRLKQRVAAELKTTFASHYAQEATLAEALRPESMALYSQRATGAKILITPNRFAP